mmetsp:Transcript_29592/g.81362  ORF Transcript_29592/g.81362 Transcript_29592/m.81362 type:complete len:200 (+) Transcript_29592:439-1038(+)
MSTGRGRRTCLGFKVKLRWRDHNATHRIGNGNGAGAGGTHNATNGTDRWGHRSRRRHQHWCGGRCGSLQHRLRRGPFHVHPLAVDAVPAVVPDHSLHHGDAVEDDKAKTPRLACHLVHHHHSIDDRPIAREVPRQHVQSCSLGQATNKDLLIVGAPALHQTARVGEQQPSGAGVWPSQPREVHRSGRERGSIHGGQVVS